MSDMHDCEEIAEKGNGKDEEDLKKTGINASSGPDESDAAGSEAESTNPDDQPPADVEQPDTLSIEEDFHRLLQEKDELLAQKQDQLLRAHADYENYKKRMAREKDDLYKFGNERLMKELLPILDNFERSLTHAKETRSLDGILEGVDLIRKELLNTLTKFGLSEISAKGEKFDPSKHEATAQVPTADHPEGTVMDEFQKGYFVHDRLLRPAMVIVAGPPAEPEEEDEQ